MAIYPVYRSLNWRSSVVAFHVTVQLAINVGMQVRKKVKKKKYKQISSTLSLINTSFSNATMQFETFLWQINDRR